MAIGGTGLRGITDIKVDFNYPVTAICGRNGTGKSTILALAALAYHKSPGHLPINALRGPKSGEDCTYYTFADFFFRGPGDSPASGVTWRWTYDSEPPTKSISVTRSSAEKWMHYERRPARPVHFIGIARTVPAIERRVLRYHFPISSTAETDIPLDATFKPILERLMGRSYTDAAIMRTSGHSLRRATSDLAYSSFNMGAGEDLLIELLGLFQGVPNGSLVVVEEIELGLHPAAVRALARELQQIALDKGLQILVTTHSFDFLDEMPRVARILIQRAGGSHVVTYGPTARYAMGEMSGKWNAEMIIACEDDFAAALIGSCLDGKDARRSRVITVGSKDSLAQFANYHCVAGGEEKVMLVWDGDVEDTEIDRLQKVFERGGVVDPRINWTRLPGTTPPERWVEEALGDPEAVACLAARLREPEDFVQRCVSEVTTAADHHGLIFRLAETFSRPEAVVSAAVLEAVQETRPDAMGDLGRQIHDAIEGSEVREPAPVRA